MRLAFILNSFGSGGAERVVASLANYWVSQGHEVHVITFGTTSEFYYLDPTVRRHSIATGANGALKRNLILVGNLRRSLLEIRPEFAMSHMLTANVLLAIGALGLRDVNTIGVEHNFPPRAALNRYWAFMRRFFYGYLGGVVALTSEGKEWLEQNTNSKKVHCIPNPVEYPIVNVKPTVEVPKLSKATIIKICY